MNTMIIVLLILTWITADPILGEIQELINTKAATSDLKWTAFPLIGGWEEVSGWDENSRSIRFYQVCNRQNPDNDNWVRTPYIRSNGAKRAFIDVEFSMMACEVNKTKNCRETFNLYYYESNRDVATSTFPPWRERPYIKIDTIAAGKRFTTGGKHDRDINRKTWTLGPLKQKGFYIAAHDKGACMSLLSLKVYYFYCPATTVAMGYFPRTVAGEEVASLVTVNGKCVDYSIEASNEGPRYHCNSNGEWRVRTGTCQCIPGYQSNNNMKVCEACTSGKYKTKHGNHECTSCPRNSVSSGPGPVPIQGLSGSSVSRFVEKPTRAPAFCRCLPGFFRAPDEDVHQICSRPPSKPTDVNYIVNETSTVIDWTEPSDLGDRVDIYYNVTCERCLSSSFIDCRHCENAVTFEPGKRLTSSHLQINDLSPYTHYQFKIYAMNGVSSVSGPPVSYALVKVRTNQAAPSKVVSVRMVESSGRSVTLAWSLPNKPNGPILGYEIQVTEIDDKGELSAFLLEPHVPASYSTENRSLAIPDLQPGTNYAVKVRAQTAAGYGDFSELYMARTEEVEETDLSGESESGRIGLLVGIGTSVVVFFAISAGAYFVYNRRKSHTSQRFEDSSLEAKDSFEDARQLVVHLPAETSAHRLYVEYPDPQEAVREFAAEIDSGMLEIDETIGQGEFGEVFSGKLHDSVEKDGEYEEVAIKRLKQGANVKDQLNFLREASNMSQFDHPNVLTLKGVVTKTRPLMIVSEYMENGSLNNFLKGHQGELNLLQLTNMLHGIAHGMRYLCNIQYVHRDLAARNILVNSDLVCKVSDFGLSRTLENDPHATYTTQGGKIALRWTAPECIRFRQFTSASDVWSFGIVMWEVMSYGEKPYWDMTNEDVLDSIEEGYRLPAPYECPGVLHKIMIECWTMEPKQRPTFDQLVQRFEEIISSPDMFKDTTPTLSSSTSKSTEDNSSED